MTSIDVLLVPIQALFIYAIVVDDGLRRFAVLMAVTSSFDALTDSVLGEFIYYERQALFSALLCCSALYIESIRKCIAIQLICGFSAFMSMYELSSYYQTFWYPYRDSFEWWSVEVIMFIAVYKERTVFDGWLERMAMNNHRRKKAIYTKSP